MALTRCLVPGPASSDGPRPPMAPGIVLQRGSGATVTTTTTNSIATVSSSASTVTSTPATVVAVTVHPNGPTTAMASTTTTMMLKDKGAATTFSVLPLPTSGGKHIDEEMDEDGGGLIGANGTGTFCGIFCPRSLGRALDKLLDLIMGAVQSSSTSSPSVSSCSSPTRRSPEPDSLEAKIALIVKLLGKRPSRMAYGIQRAVQFLTNASQEEKVEMLREGVLVRICALITQYSNIDVAAPPLAESPRESRSLGVSTGSLEVIGEQGQEQLQKNGDRAIARRTSGPEQPPQPRRASQQQQAANTTMSKRTMQQQKRPGSAGSARINNGVGYGTGSTKSRWNIERTVEERSLREEHLVWLLSALIAFLWGDQLSERLSDWEMSQAHKGGERRRSESLEGMPAHLALMGDTIAQQIGPSAVIPLLAYHLSNDSVLDVSQHMAFYQVLFELCAGLAAIPAMVSQLVLPRDSRIKSIAKELVPQFRDNLNNYPTLVRGISEADLTFMDFIRKINDYSEVIIRLARQFERQIPAEKRIKTSHAHRYLTRLGGVNSPVMQQRRRRSLTPVVGTMSPLAAGSMANIADIQSPGIAHSTSHNGLFSASVAASARQRNSAAQQRRLARRLSAQQVADLNSQSLNEQYREVLRELQMSTYRLLNDAGKPVHGFSFKRELRSVNPFSATHKDRTKRIAKELASMHNSLPLNASNAIFVCMDETRCDILKVLVTGPDDTPYENGLFEFDVFFPANYPHQPPKCSFLTTGDGNVRFNPNLYNDGKICLSILGTWEGRPEEKWNPFCSLLQVLISIQGLIFVRHPYFNEPGFEKFQRTSKGDEFSRKYNLHIENATLVYAIYEQWKNGSPHFTDIIRRHFWLKRHAVIRQAERWLQEVAEDIKNSQGGQSQELLDGMVDGIFSSSSVQFQRQTVRKLIEEFRDMDNPLLADCCESVDEVPEG